MTTETKKKSSEAELYEELANNGSEKMQQLFLECQKENNRQMRRLADVVEMIAIGSVHLIGFNTAKEIVITCQSIKETLKP